MLIENTGPSESINNLDDKDINPTGFAEDRSIGFDPKMAMVNPSNTTLDGGGGGGIEPSLQIACRNSANSTSSRGGTHPPSTFSEEPGRSSLPTGYLDRQEVSLPNALVLLVLMMA